ncbi:hypothetical protein FRC10_003004, partial [Ceratobasidium sp. 414]
ERDYESRKSRPDRDDRDGDSDSRRKRHRSRSSDKDERERYKSKRTRSRSQERKEKDKKRDKSAERAARKAEKRRAKEELGASLPTVAAELSAYYVLDNPFHDANLNQQFKWHKKEEKKAGISVQESQRGEATRRQEAREELDRLNKRRAEREVEQQLREEEDAWMQRLAESAQMAEWISKEGDFQLEQEQRRAGIRLKEKRGKAIDFLALNLKFATDDDGRWFES